MKVHTPASADRWRSIFVPVLGSSIHEIGADLAHDFAGDYQSVLDKARRAVADRPIGPFRLSAGFTRVRNGRVLATGAGLVMPVEAEGWARISGKPATPPS